MHHGQYITSSRSGIQFAVLSKISAGISAISQGVKMSRNKCSRRVADLGFDPRRRALIRSGLSTDIYQFSCHKPWEPGRGNPSSWRRVAKRRWARRLYGTDLIQAPTLWLIVVPNNFFTDGRLRAMRSISSRRSCSPELSVIQRSLRIHSV